ncbi:hypothetical protein M5K25_009833 [Dendrobium thyrsiflorum]|uniref:Uncharacterized protein n=1 Tax=Dendrobium thyrsiflorum TaxID=117978 RepID=A0ABD0VDJ1_DENTH
MAELVEGPIMEKIINACSDYLKEQVGWQTGMKEEVLERLKENHPKIQAVLDFAANQAEISDQNPALNKWIWQLRDAIDEANDVLDEFEYMKHKEQLPKNTEETKTRKFESFLFESARKILKIGQRALKRDPNLKRLEEAVQKLDKVSADVTTFLHLLDSAKQEQKEQEVDFFKTRETGSLPKNDLIELRKEKELVTTFLHLSDRAKQEQKEQEDDFYKTRETGSLPKNDLIGLRKEKELVMEWLRNPSNDYQTTLYGNISLLSIVGHGGMGKTTLLQHVYKDEITKEFDLKMWVCVSNNFDAKKVIADMLECLKKKRPRLETLVALQVRLEEEVMSKKFLLVLDDIWEEEDEEKYKSKWEDVLAPLASGRFGSKILVTTRTDSVALMFSKVIKKKKEIVKLEGLEETGSLPKNDLIGRGKEKEFVMHWLRTPSNDHRTTWYRNISLLSIVGHGGMGKTTLLQHVYKAEITKEFDLKMWVCVSNNFDAKKVIAVMLESLDKKKPDLDSLDALQGRLQIAVRCKKFLLILDDIWEEEEDHRDINKWENVLAPLASGGFGSKILVTTRTDSVALMFAKVIKKKSEIFRLKGLEEDECLQLLNSHALADVKNPNDYIRLRSIAREIVKRLLGSPLAAKVIGGVLNSSLDERYWAKVLNSDFASPKLGQNNIFIILRLSYMFLPKHLQKCFAFCSIFRQDYWFRKDDLVKMWIALGFIEPAHDQEQTMEDIGGMYFDVLVKKSFFDKFEELGLHYKMHDLIHELTQSVSIHECLSVEDDTKLPYIISGTLRHLSVQTTNLDILRKIGNFKYLHSLFLFCEASNQNLCNVLIEVLKASRSLRLLYVFAPGLEMIPEEIGNLIHLRYLKIFCCNLSMLPRSLSNLYHLQYIIIDEQGGLDQPKGDDFLPSDINNLSNLRYVKLPENCISSICGIGKLNSLQELDTFDLRDVSGYRIGELKNMIDLCKLGINCLENVKDAEEARNAQLCEKRRLTDLTLCWSDNNSRNIDLYENVLDNLQPPKCLRNLSIKKYMGARSAIWMNNVNPIFNLQKIELEDCSEWETLPPFGQLRFLKSLTLSGMPKVKWLESKFNGNDKYRAFPLLEVLRITKLEALEDWFEAGVAAEDGCLFPCLIQLDLYHCPKLKELPSLPPKLKSLQIDGIGWTTLNFPCNSNPISLENLNVVRCPKITSLPLADEIARLAALRDLTIIDCPNLISLGRYREMETTNICLLILNNLRISDPSLLLMEPLTSIASLKKLIIVLNDELVSFPNEAEQWFLKVSSSLSYLEFYKLKSLESLPSSLESLSSLQKLYIIDVPMLRELPNLPPNLQLLSIGKCHPELKERYREDRGSDRHKIAHIPHIHIRPQ